MEFGKPATTLNEQIELLRQRGMAADDADRPELLSSDTRHYLRHINYYRLTGRKCQVLRFAFGPKCVCVRHILIRREGQAKGKT